MLPIWEPEAPLDVATRHAWGLAAQRIATGLRELAHLPVTADDEQAILAFPEPEGVAAAAEWVRSIRGENVEARVGRACAYAASGWPEPCQADIAAIPADKVALYYPRVVSELERALQNVAGELRETIRAARLTPKKTAVIERASRNLRASAGLARLAALYPPPAKHRDSHARRDLAHNLLQQACGEALEFAKSGKEDIADEASISLGEALKQFQQIREQYEKESTNKTP